MSAAGNEQEDQRWQGNTKRPVRYDSPNLSAAWEPASLPAEKSLCALEELGCKLAGADGHRHEHWYGWEQCRPRVTRQTELQRQDALGTNNTLLTCTSIKFIKAKDFYCAIYLYEEKKKFNKILNLKTFTGNWIIYTNRHQTYHQRETFPPVGQGHLGRSAMTLPLAPRGHSGTSLYHGQSHVHSLGQHPTRIFGQMHPMNCPENNSAAVKIIFQLFFCTNKKKLPQWEHLFIFFQYHTMVSFWCSLPSSLCNLPLLL